MYNYIKVINYQRLSLTPHSEFRVPFKWCFSYRTILSNFSSTLFYYLWDKNIWKKKTGCFPNIIFALSDECKCLCVFINQSAKQNRLWMTFRSEPTLQSQANPKGKRRMWQRQIERSEVASPTFRQVASSPEAQVGLPGNAVGTQALGRWWFSRGEVSTRSLSGQWQHGVLQLKHSSAPTGSLPVSLSQPANQSDPGTFVGWAKLWNHRHVPSCVPCATFRDSRVLLVKQRVEPFLPQRFRVPFENVMKVKSPTWADAHTCNIAHTYDLGCLHPPQSTGVA